MLPRFPFTFRKDYGVSAARGIIYTATRGTPGKVAITWTSNGEHSVTLQYADEEVATFLGTGTQDPLSYYQTFGYTPTHRWILIAEAPLVEQPKAPLHFSGKTFNQERDGIRLTGQYLRVSQLMQDGQWRSLSDIAKATKDPEASVSARLRDLRKERFGSHTVERRHVSDGLFEYRLAA